ncbi:MAG: cysteine--1-D-myo-inosityl 2-amino-2-deoxy-alpha-D-glucopyranoside ligase [Corynebacterium sp.]|nr:cysteine--1-D-myo-inosityl 2-amino-2-deoxy-alpha-D-glucopyranoside ligase [Corynebacterium sp.]
MHPWPSPHLDPVPGTPVPLRLYSSHTQSVTEVRVGDGSTARVYVCGITPYDATHLGHAATYLTFDLINRMLLDNGYRLHYVQNVTDADDPLFERAARDGVDWRELADSQIALFAQDMTALSVIAPDDYVSIDDAVGDVIATTRQLVEAGVAYVLDDPVYPDVYASVDATSQFGYESQLSREEMLPLFVERGGDPDRPGKRNRLDALLWRVERDRAETDVAEPAWDSPWGRGRPGWHIECAAIAQRYLGVPFDIQGGGSDLVFPHHEFSAAHVEAATGVAQMAGHYVHTGMIGLGGTKMSKSLGNLVFVHELLADGVDPSAIRLAIVADHYRCDRDFSQARLAEASARLDRWRAAVQLACDEEAAHALVAAIRERLACDLDTPGMIDAVDTWADATIAGGDRQPGEGGHLVAHGLRALTGIDLG